MLTIITPSKHVVKDTSTAKLFRRRLNFEDILTFWNAETGQWVLAYWVDKPRRIVDEMDDLGMSFEKVTPDLISMVVTCWKTVNWKAKKQRLVSKEADRIRKEVDTIQEEQRRWDWAKKQLEAQGKKPLPYVFKSPISGGEVQ
jgi:hypothetical protein